MWGAARGVNTVDQFLYHHKALGLKGKVRIAQNACRTCGIWVGESRKLVDHPLTNSKPASDALTTYLSSSRSIRIRCSTISTSVVAQLGYPKGFESSLSCPLLVSLP
jgi:hypothetical protein